MSEEQTTMPEMSRDSFENFCVHMLAHPEKIEQVAEAIHKSLCETFSKGKSK